MDLKRICAILLLASASLLTACSSGAQPQTTSAPTATGQGSELQTQVSPAATEQATDTPVPGKVLLLAPAGSDAGGEAQALLADLSKQTGLALDVREGAQPGDLGPEVRIVAALAPPPNLPDLLAAAPQTQFVVLSAIDLAPGANLSVIRQRPENQAFVAGFVSVLLSTDWRSAGLLPADGPLGPGLADAFVNGGSYFCGSCTPGWPLGQTYPQAAALPSNSDGPAWQAAAAGLFDSASVEVFYLSAEAARPEVYDSLRDKVQFMNTVVLLGAQTPPDTLRPQWAATVGMDGLVGIRQLWPDLTAGKGGAVIDAPVALADVNENLLPEGRMRLVEDLIEELTAGSIYPFSVPE